jgi:hypothetical protein
LGLTLPLPHPVIEDQQVQQNFEALASKVPNYRATFGTGSVTWTAAFTSANTTITHGLPVTPIFVGLTSYNALTMYWLVSKSATNFVVAGTFTDAVARTNTLNFEWIAFG